MESNCVCRNYVTTDDTIPLVIYVIFCMLLFLFESQLLRKWLYITNTVGFIYIQKSDNCIYIYNKIAVYIMNLDNDVKNVTFINIYLLSYLLKVMSTYA